MFGAESVMWTLSMTFSSTTLLIRKSYNRSLFALSHDVHGDSGGSENGCFLSCCSPWWILQFLVYFKLLMSNPHTREHTSDTGMNVCVWNMHVWQQTCLFHYCGDVKQIIAASHPLHILLACSFNDGMKIRLNLWCNVLVQQNIEDVTRPRPYTVHCYLVY